MSGRYIRPAIIQSVGLLLLIGATVFWMVTARESAMLLSAAVSLIGLGAYADLRHTLKTEVGVALPDDPPLEEEEP